MRGNDRTSTALIQKKEKDEEEDEGGREGKACETATEEVCMCQENVVS